MIIFFTIFFTIYTAANYYIFIRGWQALTAIPAVRPVYLFLFVFAAASYILARVFSTKLPPVLYDIFLWVGSFWFAFMMYFFLSILLLDVLRLLNHWIGFFPAFVSANYEKTKLITFISIFVIVTGVIISGYINTRNIKVTDVNLTLPKKKSSLTELKIVMAADFHLTPVNNGKLLNEIVKKINGLNPDIVLLPGDIVDDDVKVLRERDIGPALKNINAPLGVFASTGNHEFISGIQKSDPFIRDMNISLIRDSSITIDDKLTIIARDDRSKKNFTNKDRASLDEIMEEVNKDYPLILLDHTPLGLEDAVNNGIDLQLSGHTHHGQLWPNNLITNMIYEVSWGYLKKEDSQFYVTSGVGTWGPPVRTGSYAEIVNIKVKFE